MSNKYPAAVRFTAPSCITWSRIEDFLSPGMLDLLRRIRNSNITFEGDVSFVNELEYFTLGLPLATLPSY